MCAVLCAACEKSVAPAAPGIPVALAAQGLANPENVLSARIVFDLVDADSVRVRLESANATTERTGFYASRDGTDTIIVLGLKPNRTYQYAIEAVSHGVSHSSSEASFHTAELPAPLAAASMSRVSGAASRYALTGINSGGNYAVAFDTSGAVAWYHDFTSRGLAVSNVVRQPNGNYTAFLGTTSGWQPVDGYFVEFTPEGKEVATYRAPPGFYLDGHELLLTGDGAAKRWHALTYTIRTLDLSSIGGESEVQTAGHQLIRANQAGAVEFSWNAWDHIDVDEWLGDGAAKARTETDFDHPNAITFDAIGNYIVSWRNLDQIMAIDPQTGDVLWRLGGAKGEYEFVDDPLGGFNKQHAVKILPNGDVLVFDNGSDRFPQPSRAVEYRLDHAAKTATMVWESRHDPVINALYLGWVQRLENGNTWIAYSWVGRVVEVTPDGAVVWEGQLRTNGVDAVAYRIVPLNALY